MCHGLYVFSFSADIFQPEVFQDQLRVMQILNTFMIFNLLVKTIVVETVSNNFQNTKGNIWFVCEWENEKCFATYIKSWCVVGWMISTIFRNLKSRKTARYIEIIQEAISLYYKDSIEFYKMEHFLCCHNFYLPISFLLPCSKFENAFNLWRLDYSFWTLIKTRVYTSINFFFAQSKINMQISVIHKVIECCI